MFLNFSKIAFNNGWMQVSFEWVFSVGETGKWACTTKYLISADTDKAVH